MTPRSFQLAKHLIEFEGFQPDDDAVQMPEGTWVFRSKLPLTLYTINTEGCATVTKCSNPKTFAALWRDFIASGVHFTGAANCTATCVPRGTARGAVTSAVSS